MDMGRMRVTQFWIHKAYACALILHMHDGELIAGNMIDGDLIYIWSDWINFEEQNV